MDKHLKPWWISCVFPDGKSPDKSLIGGPERQLEAILHAAFQSRPSDGLVAPSAFGINCTDIKYISELSPGLLQYLETFETDKPRPWMVLYANDGKSYDESTGLWKGHKGEGHEMQWAKDVSKVFRNCVDDDVWEGKRLGGIILGGCCKTTPDDISRLRSCLQPTNADHRTVIH